MQIAMYENKRTLASPGIKGLCQICREPMRAKCGKIRIWHWAHIGKICAGSSEGETDWHRNWKERFPIEWREIKIEDPQTQKSRIADLFLPTNLAIELQHSAIKEEDRAAREDFYKSMVWIVHLMKSEDKFLDFLSKEANLQFIDERSRIAVTWDPEKYFPKSWLNSRFPVFFDIDVADSKNIFCYSHEWLWCLLPERAERRAVILKFPRNELVERIKTSAPIFKKSNQEIINMATNYIRNERQIKDSEFNEKFIKEIRQKSARWNR